MKNDEETKVALSSRRSFQLTRPLPSFDERLARASLASLLCCLASRCTNDAVGDQHGVAVMKIEISDPGLKLPCATSRLRNDQPSSCHHTPSTNCCSHSSIMVVGMNCMGLNCAHAGSERSCTKKAAQGQATSVRRVRCEHQQLGLSGNVRRRTQECVALASGHTLPSYPKNAPSPPRNGPLSAE
jgi:hypothetical protein